VEWKDSLAPSLLLKTPNPCLQEIVEGNEAEKLLRVEALDYWKACESCLCHPIHHRCERLVQISLDRIRSDHIGNPSVGHLD
jgi:hypothetical protein